MKHSFVIAICSMLMLGLMGCESQEQVTTGDLDKLKAEIMDLISDKTCQNPEDCAIIAFGAKPCGGPNSYLVFAKSTVDQTLLEDKVNDYNQLEHQFNVENGLLSDCAVVTPPQVVCQDGVCAAQ